MQLQYVFGVAGNPKKPKKRSKGLGKARKKAKMKQGGNPVGKLSGKAKAAFLARMNKGRKKAGLKAIGKKRRKRNPYILDVPEHRKKTKVRVGGAEVDGFVKRKAFKSKKYYDASDIAAERKRLRDEYNAYDSERKAAKKMTPEQRAFERELGERDVMSSLKRKRQSIRSKVRDLAKKRKNYYQGKDLIDELTAEGVNFKMIPANNPKKRRKKKKKYSILMNPKKGGKKRGKKAGKKSRKKKYKKKKSKLGRLVFKRKTRRSAFLSVKKNPDLMGMVAVYVPALIGGAAYPWFNYGVNWVVAKVDGMIGGKAGEMISKADNAVPGIAAPSISLAAALGVKALDKKFGILSNLGGAAKYVDQALDTIMILSAAGIGMAGANKLKLSPQAQGLSGVKFFPGAMGGADFGTYPQLGSSADFGGVKFFPQPMGGVEFFQDGARGDEMYTSSERDDLAEAHGLGVIPEGLGVIPEGLGNADFGVIPEGMGGDEGQMG